MPASPSAGSPSLSVSERTCPRTALSPTVPVVSEVSISVMGPGRVYVALARLVTEAPSELAVTTPHMLTVTVAPAARLGMFAHVAVLVVADPAVYVGPGRLPL